MVERGLDARKFAHVPNGIPIARAPAASDGDLPTIVERRVEEDRQAGRFLVGYAGGLTLAMAVETLVETARILATSGATFVAFRACPQSAHPPPPVSTS